MLYVYVLWYMVYILGYPENIYTMHYPGNQGSLRGRYVRVVWLWRCHSGQEEQGTPACHYEPRRARGRQMAAMVGGRLRRRLAAGPRAAASPRRRAVGVAWAARRGLIGCLPPRRREVRGGRGYK